MKTFKCNFGAGIVCEIEVADHAPEKGTTHILRVAWTGRPTQKVIQPYIGWMNSVNQDLADEWGVRLMHIFQTSARWQNWEVWTYMPGEKPRQEKL